MNTHPEQWAAILLQRLGSSWGFGGLLKGVYIYIYIHIVRKQAYLGKWTASDRKYRRSLRAEYTVCIGHQLPGRPSQLLKKNKVMRYSRICARSRLNANDHYWWTSITVKRHQKSGTKKRKKKMKTKPVYFLCIQKVFSSLHKILIEPLMADGLSWWCFSYFSEPQQCYLLGSRWDSHKPPGLYINILKSVPKMNKAFMELERLAGKWIMTHFHFGVD